MDHSEAARIAAVDKYLLGELPDSQREAFEEHFFSCPECSGRVRLGAVFHANARAVLKETGSLASIAPERRRPWSGWSFRPAFAMAGGLALALIVGYQNLVLIPRLRNQAAGGAEMTMVDGAQVSGVRAAADQSFSRRDAQFTLFVPHEWEEFYSSYTCELERRPGSKVVLTARRAASADFGVLVQTAPLEPGKYVMNVYGLRADGQKTAVARFPLTLTD
jgi:hypothetical protein